MGRVGRIALALIAFFGAAIGAGLAWRAWRQHETAQVLHIGAPRGIDEGIYVKIGGIDQWVQIRGDDRANPCLLILNGGPGFSMMGLAAVFQPWERYFTVVQWDQRGEGKTFGRSGEAESGAMSIDRMTRDGLELTRFLRQHLKKDKIIVLGHSWGTVLGLRMVKLRPDMFSAYVGTGQLVDKELNDKVDYMQLMQTARKAKNAVAIGELEDIGPPPYRSSDTLSVLLKWETAYATKAERDLYWAMAPYVLFSPNYSPRDIYDFLAGIRFSLRKTYVEFNAYDARTLGPNFAVPFFIIQGDRDMQTPVVLAEQYFETVRAPQKEFILLRGGGHSAILTMPDEFLKELLTCVRPWTVKP